VETTVQDTEGHFFIARNDDELMVGAYRRIHPTK
jgi:hypothetical protein